MKAILCLILMIASFIGDGSPAPGWRPGYDMGMAVKPLYEVDFATWAEGNAKALREKRFCDVDVANVAAEIESMGKAESRKLESQLRRLILHLLKWRFQQLRRSPSWRRSIAGSRIQIEKILQDSPSLNSKLAILIADAYPDAVYLAVIETGTFREMFPTDCPYSIQQLRDQGFLPD